MGLVSRLVALSQNVALGQHLQLLHGMVYGGGVQGLRQMLVIKVLRVA